MEKFNFDVSAQQFKQLVKTCASHDMTRYPGHFDRVQVGMSLHRDAGYETWENAYLSIILPDDRPRETSFVFGPNIPGCHRVEMYYSGEGKDTKAALWMEFGCPQAAAEYMEDITRGELCLNPPSEWGYCETWRTDHWTTDETGHNPTINVEVAYPTWSRKR